MRRPTAWLGLVLAALIVNACQLLTRTDELEVTTSTGAGGGGASSASTSASTSTSASGGGGSDGGGSSGSGFSCTLHCKEAFDAGGNTNDPALCPMSKMYLTSLKCCACNTLACGGSSGYPCQQNPNQDWCDGVPASFGCMSCLMTNCQNLLSTCLADQ